MKPWKLYCMGLAPLAFLASSALAQGLPAITPPPGVAIAPQPPPVNAPVPPAALPPNIWDKLSPRADQCAACKAKFCNSRIGQLINNMLAPAGAMTGGILGPCCPTINAADLAKPPDSAEGAAARLKLDEADAAGRRAAIRYMAGADCHYWPEVQDALIGALRADRNECVRLEAALALGRGCCCSRATMLALTLTVSGATDDGNPPEDSERVRMAAMAALNHCLSNYVEVVPAPEPATIEHRIEPVPPRVEPIVPPRPGEPVPPPKPDKLPGADARPFGPTEYYHHAANLDEKRIVAAARRATEHVAPLSPTAPSTITDHSVFGIVRAAVTPTGSPVSVPEAVVMEKPAVVIEKPVAAAPKPVVHNMVIPAVATQPSKAVPVEKAPTPPPPPAPLTPASCPAPAPKTAPVTTASLASAPVAPANSPPAAPKAASVVTPAALAPAPVPAHTATVKVAPAPTATVKTTPAAAPQAPTTAVAASLATLRDSIYPEERTKAAETLGDCGALPQPPVVQALVEAARTDAAPTVRAACLRSLSKLDVHTAPVVGLAETLKTDPDAHVRAEAEHALRMIGGASSNAQ